MDAPASTQASYNQREHLERAHHEICTALTVFRSNVELVRIHLRDAPLPANGIPVHAHLDELEGAVERLRDVAQEMKRWHDGLAPDPSDEPPEATAKQGKGSNEHAL
jgi:hypothetical protein